MSHNALVQMAFSRGFRTLPPTDYTPSCLMYTVYHHSLPVHFGFVPCPLLSGAWSLRHSTHQVINVEVAVLDRWVCTAAHLSECKVQVHGQAEQVVWEDRLLEHCPGMHGRRMHARDKVEGVVVPVLGHAKVLRPAGRANWWRTTVYRSRQGEGRAMIRPL